MDAGCSAEPSTAFSGMRPGRVRADLLGAAANALGMDKAALITALRSGDSLQKITSDHGKSYADVSKAIHDAAKANLDALVAAKKLTQAREDAILAQLDKALADGTFPGHGPGRGLGFPAPRQPQPGQTPAAATS